MVVKNRNRVYKAPGMQEGSQKVWFTERSQDPVSKIAGPETPKFAGRETLPRWSGGPPALGK